MTCVVHFLCLLLLFAPSFHRSGRVNIGYVLSVYKVFKKGATACVELFSIFACSCCVVPSFHLPQILCNRLEGPSTRSTKLARFCLSFCLQWPFDKASSFWGFGRLVSDVPCTADSHYIHFLPAYTNLYIINIGLKL